MNVTGKLKNIQKLLLIELLFSEKKFDLMILKSQLLSLSLPLS
jgi:hypothetical protein